MDILNVMWGGGSAFVSVHNVHREILRLSGSSSIATLLLTSGEAEPLLDVGNVSALGFSSKRIKGRGLEAFRRWFDRRRLAKWLSMQELRVVVLDGLGVASYLLPLLVEQMSARVIVLFHGNKHPTPAQVRMLQLFPADRLELVAVSETLAIDLEHQIGIRVLGGRIALEPSVLRLSLLNREEALLALGLEGQVRGRIIGAVGRLVTEKGFDLLLTASSQWLKSHPEDHLVLVGEGPERENLGALATQLGIADQVHLIGHVPTVRRLYRAFDLLCIPSQQEGLGLVLPEAIIAGVPVLATDLPVFREQLGGSIGLVGAGQRAAWELALSNYLQGDLNTLRDAQQAGMAPERAWENFIGFYRELLR
ncbi:glycosyltransferase [Pseudomonas sp. sia0905]|uniref:glycosyltransferase n=1 Tax=Pseudomonas sp. sia0905 TaxID=2854783 RepID=UPI001C4627B9|nr:glycosyltransferase [Pseudomonas sp. sia0905]MBV7563371.1 glycosyltransferase [Pseudomonas sp. sia0905]